MIVAGLDISKSATGWAVTDGTAWESGVWKCPIAKPADLAVGRIDAAYTGAVADWLSIQITSFLAANRPDHVGIEQPMPGNSSRMKMGKPKGFEMGDDIPIMAAAGNTSFDVTHFLHGLCVIACRCCVRLNCQPLYVASQTWRSTVKIGRAPKQDVIKNKIATLSYSQRRTWYKNAAKAVCARRGIPIIGPDQAEAVCLTLHMQEILYQQTATANLFARGAA
jgi:hypothetical protein